MSLRILLLILASVTLSATAQMAMKAGMMTASVAAALAEGERLRIGLAIAGSPLVIGGLALYGLAAALWLFVLARIDVSVAYPFVGLGFLLTMAFGALFLGEGINATRLLGTFLVAGGVYLVAQS